jgi:hypothetical protein
MTIRMDAQDITGCFIADSALTTHLVARKILNGTPLFHYVRFTLFVLYAGAWSNPKIFAQKVF